MITLFSWFNSKIAATYQPTLRHSARSRRIHLHSSAGQVSPAEILRRLGAPDELADTFALLMDCEITLKTATDGEVPDLERREKKRKRSTGQFYTPENLAARLVEIAEPGLAGDILDPACGDGSFLMAMARKLAQNKTYPQIAQMFADELKGHCEETSSTTCPTKLELRQKKSPGYSVSGRFASIAMLTDTRPSMALSGKLKRSSAHSVIARSEATKQSLCEAGFLNRLHGFDIDLPALFICLTRLICAFPGCGWPSLAHRDFLTDPPARRYSVIIGNPPYRVNLDDSFKRRLAELYETGEGEKDLYTFFIEGSLKSLQPGGRLVMLTSHTYLVNHQCGRIRRFIFAGYHARALFMLPERFFAHAPGVLPVVLVADADQPPDNYLLNVFANYSEADGWQQQYSAEACAFEEPSGLRRSIVSPQLQQVFSIMNGCERLGEHCRVGVGIQESLKRDGKVSRYVCDRQLSAASRPVLRGRELSPFAINWEGNYIDYGPHLAYSGDEAIFAGPKILYQNIRNERLKIRLVAAYDEGRFFPKNSLSYVLAISADVSDLFVLGLFNSLLVNAWFSGNFHSFHITVTQVRQIPLPACSITLRQRIEKLVVRLRQIPAGTPQWHKSFEQLNLVVCECYLGAGDHKQLLTICDNFLDQAASL